MFRITIILREVVRLFIDDGRFAVTIVIWLAIVGLALPRLGVPTSLTGIALFAGVAAILVESAMGAAGRERLNRAR